jgi:signal transduction histidine kinase
LNLKSIKTRLLLFYSITITILLTLFCIILLYIFYQQNVKTIESQLLVVAQDIDYEIRELYDNNFQDEFNKEYEYSISNLIIKVISKKDTPHIVASNNQHFEIESFDRVQKGKYIPYTIYKNEIELLGISYRSLFLDDFYFEIETTINDKIEKDYKQLRNLLFILIPIGVVLFIFVGYFMIRNSFKSVKKVINQVHQIEIKDLSSRIERLNSNDEIDELIETFNVLLNKVDESVEKIKRFSNDVSHELKTPLTVIRGEIELSLRKDRDIESYKEVLKTLLAETESLQELIDSLLFLSTKNKKELKKEFIALQIDYILLDCIEDMESIAVQKEIQIELEKLESVEVIGNEILLKTMINNIFQNAIKYSEEKSKIILTLEEKQLKIKDYGMGIKKEELEYIFDRFYRSDVARSRDGFGLGLSIVALICSLHNFKIDIQSEFGEYTEVIIDFDT